MPLGVLAGWVAGWDVAARSAFASARPARFWTPRFSILAALFVLAMVVWRAVVRYPTGVFDSYPLYYGGQAWLATGNAYALDAIIPPDQRNFQLYQIGNVYPFPAVLVALPFSLLPAQLAAVLWVGSLSAGLVLALRLHDWPFWYLLYLPILEGLRIEQFTMFAVLFQLLALWAWRERRPWLLAVCCVLSLTKPNHSFFLVLALIVLAGNWRHFLTLVVPLLGTSFALYPGWVADWLPRLENSHAVLQQPFLWGLALCAIPLFLLGDIISGALLLQFALLPYPGIYSSASLPLGVIGDRRSRWLIVVAPLWVIVGVTLGTGWATGLALTLPVVTLSLLRQWPRWGDTLRRLAPMTAIGKAL